MFIFTHIYIHVCKWCKSQPVVPAALPRRRPGSPQYILPYLKLYQTILNTILYFDIT